MELNLYVFGAYKAYIIRAYSHSPSNKKIFFYLLQQNIVPELIIDILFRIEAEYLEIPIKRPNSSNMPTRCVEIVNYFRII